MKIYLRNYFILLIASCSPKADSNHILIPGVGVGDVLIGGVEPIKHSESLMLFKDSEMKIEYIFTEDASFKLAFAKEQINIGDEFESINPIFRRNLKKDLGTSDKLIGDHYISNDGYAVSTLNGKIKGIGVCRNLKKE